MVLTRSSHAASMAATPAPSASRIQTRSSSSPNIASASPFVYVGAPAPSSSASHTIFPSKSNRKKHKMHISMKMNDESVEEHYHKIWFYGKPALISGGLVAINVVKKLLTSTQKSKFKSTSFGHFLDFEPLVFNGQLVHCMLLKEVFHLNPNEMMFKVHETLLKFSISDFSIITGLNCANYPSFCNEDGIPK
ncbi:hypothetical protein UlMin_028622 [Ulmus minor]